MTLVRTGAANYRLRRGGHSSLRPPGVLETVLSLRPDVPVHCLRPAVFEARAKRFVESFPGNVLYAVKCNPDPQVLQYLWNGGVRHFDAASINEVRLVRGLLPDAGVHFMHPIKSRKAIREAYFEHGIRDFVLDSADELSKIVEETTDPSGRRAFDLGLFVRIALPKGGALWDLSGKFGAEPSDAVRLLRLARMNAQKLGICFHVGSQCIDPGAYERGLAIAKDAVLEAGVAVEVIDVGGGFPVSYPDMTPPPLSDFLAAIQRGIDALPFTCEIWCEPGRALVAAGGSLVVQVQARRDDFLYINDGIYGGLSDAGPPGFKFPARLVRAEASDAPLLPFKLYGPSCDSADRMEGPFWLPADIGEGDWIELGQLGAYSACLRTPFNGFDEVHSVEVADGPLIATPGYEDKPQARPQSRAQVRKIRAA
jgi:ornithine decarboxylase